MKKIRIRKEDGIVSFSFGNESKYHLLESANLFSVDDQHVISRNEFHKWLKLYLECRVRRQEFDIKC